MQASLPQDLVPLGATILLFGVSMSGAVFLAIGQAVFENRLIANLGLVVPETVVEQVLSTGATGIKSVVDDEYLPMVLQAYSRSITQVFVRLSLPCQYERLADYYLSTLLLLHPSSDFWCFWVRDGLGSKRKKQRKKRERIPITQCKVFELLPVWSNVPCGKLT